MERQFMDAANIMPGQRGWTCIVQTVERHPILLKKLEHYPFQKRYRHFLLTDMQGTKIKLVLFESDINFFDKYFIPFRRYKVSNAFVEVPDERYRLHGSTCSWIINSRMPVEPIVDRVPHTLPCTFDVCSFSDLHKFAESDTNIALKALIVQKFPLIQHDETISTQDYIVINEEKIPMVLRLWKDLLADYDPVIRQLHNEPVTIIASDLEVRTFHGLSLATRNTTYIIQDPPLPPNLDLKPWYFENKAEITKLIADKAYENNIKFFSCPKREEIMDLRTAMTLFETTKTCWIKAKIRLNSSRNPLYHVVCSNCERSVDAGVDWNLECTHCNVLSRMQARLKLPVTLSHDDINLRTTLKSPHAEKLCPLTAAEIARHEQEGYSVVTDISIAMDYTEVVCFLKHYDRPINGQKVRMYVILKLYTLEEMAAFNANAEPSQAQTIRLDSQDVNESSTSQLPASPASKDPADTEKQLFTPTFANTVNQIGEGSTAPTLATSPAPAAKRAISFGAVTPSDLQNVLPDDTDEETGKTVGTPQKKTKGLQRND